VEHEPCAERGENINSVNPHIVGKVFGVGTLSSEYFAKTLSSSMLRHAHASSGVDFLNPTFKLWYSRAEHSKGKSECS